MDGATHHPGRVAAYTSSWWLFRQAQSLVKDVAHRLLVGSPDIFHVVEVLLFGGRPVGSFSTEIGAEESGAAMFFRDQHDANHIGRGDW